MEIVWSSGVSDLLHIVVLSFLTPFQGASRSLCRGLIVSEMGKSPTELSERDGEEPHSEMMPHGKMVKSPTEMWVSLTVEMGRAPQRCGEAPQLSERDGEEPHSEKKPHVEMVKSSTAMCGSPTEMWGSPKEMWGSPKEMWGSPTEMWGSPTVE